MTDNMINDNVTIPENAGPTVLAGRYRVVRQLGQGGMGSVWLAEDTTLDNRQVAIKMLPSILVSNKRAYAQVKAEALVSLKLSHPNIATVRAFEEENGNPFLVMDYIDGQTLDDYLAEKGKLTEEETIHLLKPVAAALDYAHQQGVVHRDVKPGNVMIRRDGTPFVLDFGIAREVQETMTRVTGKLSSGTLMYMSPEQLNGAAPKPSQDVYSFAAMVYECLKGEPPFSRGQIEHQIEHNMPEPLDPQFAKCGLSVMAGLAKTPEARPTTCAAVLTAREMNANTVMSMRNTRLGEMSEGQKEIRLLQTVKPVFHRVSFRFSIVSTAMVLIFLALSLYFAFLLGDESGKVGSCMLRFIADNRAVGALVEASRHEQNALWAFLLMSLSLGLLLLLYAVARVRTIRALKLFEQGRWISAVHSRFFVFANDEWYLYCRACCFLWGLGCLVTDPRKAQQFFEKAAKRHNPEAYCALAWMASHQLGGPELKEWMPYLYQEAENRNSLLVERFKSDHPCGEVCKVGFNAASITVAETSVADQILRRENGLPFLFCLVWWLACSAFSWIRFSCWYGEVFCINFDFYYVFCLLVCLFPFCAIALFAVRVWLTRRLVRRTDLLKSPLMRGWWRFFTLRNDRSLLFAKGRAYLVGCEGRNSDVEKACDAFEQSACSGHVDACAVLAGLASSGRTKRYDALQTAWLVREAKTRGSKLLAAKVG